MSEEAKRDGLYKKYEVTQISKPSKVVDAIVLEFKDPIARVGIVAWADEMFKQGYVKCSDEVRAKVLAAERAANICDRCTGGAAPNLHMCSSRQDIECNCCTVCEDNCGRDI